MKSLISIFILLFSINSLWAFEYDFEDGEKIFFPDNQKSNRRSVVVDDCAKASTLKEIISYGHMIEKLGGIIFDSLEYENTTEGFQRFLSDVGVVNFSAKEMGYTDNIKKANEFGFENLIPPQGCWYRGAALALLADKLREEVDSSINLTSWYRPTQYNKYIGGSTASDHLQAKAIDLSTKGDVSKRIVMQKYICKNFWKDDLFGLQAWTENQNERLNISVGIAATFLHIGLGTIPGRRYWTYSSLYKVKNPRSRCWNY